MAVLRLNSICKAFGATKAVDEVSLSLEAGEVVALVGENGSGKSTLMRIAAGVFSPDSGTMELLGASFDPKNPYDARKCGVAMIHQELSICKDLAVWENVLLGIEPSGIGPAREAKGREIATAALAELGHADIDVNLPAKDFPISLRQIVEVARAIASGAQVIILDEPTSSLTGQDVHRLFGVIANLRKQSKSVVYISHFMEEIRAVADRVVVLRDGKDVGELSAESFDERKVVSMMVGRSVDEMYARDYSRPGEVLLDCKDLRGPRLPISASLEVRKGEILGIAGLNGSGRTELLRAIFGLDEVKAGKVSVGAYIGPGSPASRWRQGVGMLSEDRKSEGLATDLTIADNIKLSNLKGLWISPRALSASSQKWIDSLSIRCLGPDQKVSSLSGGNQQKVALARMLDHEVDLFLLDEPTRGIDVGSKQQIYALLDELAKAGRAVLMVSSYLPELLGICDRIAVMRRGTLSEAKAATDWSQEDLMTEATA